MSCSQRTLSPHPTNISSNTSYDHIPYEQTGVTLKLPCGCCRWSVCTSWLSWGIISSIQVTKPTYLPPFLLPSTHIHPFPPSFPLTSHSLSWPSLDGDLPQSQHHSIRHHTIPQRNAPHPYYLALTHYLTIISHPLSPTYPLPPIRHQSGHCCLPCPSPWDAYLRAMAGEGRIR